METVSAVAIMVERLRWRRLPRSASMLFLMVSKSSFWNSILMPSMVLSERESWNESSIRNTSMSDFLVHSGVMAEPKTRIVSISLYSDLILSKIDSTFGFILL